MKETIAIIIGRNEGERFRRSLASVTGKGYPVIYVDSASSDGSAELARSMGVEVVELDDSLQLILAEHRAILSSKTRLRSMDFENVISSHATN